MKAILDVTRVVRRLIKGQTLTGIDRVTMAYVLHYQKQAHALVRWSGRSWILSDAQSQALFEWIKAPRSRWSIRWIMILGILGYRPKPLQESVFLFNTGYLNVKQTDYIRFKQRLKVKLIFFVHDLIPIHYPEFSSAGEAGRHRAKIDYLLRFADGIVAISQATLDDLTQYAMQINQPLPKAAVALLASGLSYSSSHNAPASSRVQTQPVKQRPILKPYFVMLSTIEPRKNHGLILNVWRSLSQRFGEQAPHLFVIGQRGWECENIVDVLDRSLWLKKTVTELSDCSDADLGNFIQHSQALLFPSFIEGYGLPLVEALTLGVPVIASDLPVFREIAGAIPDYIDAIDGKQWMDLVMDYSDLNSTRRAAQIERLQHFKAPAWEDHFQTVNQLLGAM